MKTLIAIIMGIGLTIGVAQVQKTGDTLSAITETALDYADGFYSGAPERMERAIHPDLNKVTVVKLSPATKPSLQYSTYSGLIELTQAKIGFRDPDKRNINVTILKTNDNLASVKLKSPMFNDYLQMVRIDDKWKIVNVLWEPGPETPNVLPSGNYNPDSEKEAIKSAVKNYYEGSFENDITKLEKAVSPEMRIAQFTKLPQGGREFISRVGIVMIMEATRAKLRQIPDEQRKVNIDILDVMDKMAFVEAITSMSTSYLQLAKMDDEWKIINILSKQNPPQR
jgi:hypothetical protein